MFLFNSISQKITGFTDSWFDRLWQSNVYCWGEILSFHQHVLHLHTFCKTYSTTILTSQTRLLENVCDMWATDLHITVTLIHFHEMKMRLWTKLAEAMHTVMRLSSWSIDSRFQYHWTVSLTTNKHIAKPQLIGIGGIRVDNTCNSYMLHQINLLTNTSSLQPTLSLIT